MKTRILLVLILILFGGLAFAQTVPTCNGFDTTGTIPMYFATPTATGTTLCTDYFGKGNYANSPLPAGPIDITATGFTIVDGGSGYTAPVVTIADALGTPTNGIPATAASCTATASAGVITAISCGSGGTGYLAPMVNITDPTGSGAFILAKVSAAGPLVGGIRKFVDAMPDLKGAIAVPDAVTFPGSDYYEIQLVETKWQAHTDLPPTTVRGYIQAPTGTSACPNPAPATLNYLGPVIVAAKNRPVRVKFTNCLPTGAAGRLFIPMDATYMGAGNGPDGTPYTENRATLHLHGGNTPWISDGTPHQWTVPAGEVTNFKKGVSTQNVPDMFFSNGTVVPQCSATVTSNCSGGTVAQLPVSATNDPGDGSMTFYWTNQQGGRLMFYHDHAYGITRLNVYAGEAAGYYLYDPAEEAALLSATAPGTLATNAVQLLPDLAHLIPLVIQDKTFVPSAGQLAGQDPTWIWGTGAAAPGVNGNGDLWFPHVYMPNQNPADIGSANAFGRWDYGAWFFPPQTTLTAAGPGGAVGDPHGGVTIPCTSSAFPNQLLAPSVLNNFFEGCPITPNPSGTPEGFMDTPLVNGKAYPVLTVAPEAYRFQILSAGNDRSWNLQLYVADATGKEVPTLPAVPPAATTPLPLCGSVTKITQPTLGLGLPIAALDATGNPINGTGLPLNCWPNYGAPSPGISSKQFMWPADGRDGGVPDPRFAGPPFIQIGTEGGLLPAPAVIPSTPVNYEVNTRSITITNVSTHGLWLGPAERADVIIDFSKFAGQTLILYNDAPTPTPAFDMRDDYYTGGLDESTTGGAPPTLPGYGPNTRTIMQIVVSGTPTATTPFSLAALQAALPVAFKATQPAPIVPEPTYPVASGANSSTTHYARVSDRALSFSPASQPVTSIAVTSGGTGYSPTTIVNIAAPGCVAPCATATATPTIVGGVITAITVTSGGSGYTTAPLVTITDPTNTGAGAVATASLVATYIYDQKAIQELFTLDYGRMNATLGTELPLTSFQLQTTLPFGYAEWPTEILQDGQTQLWYLTHNGVDTHFIHFHLFNVQVVNRVGWDGSIRPPDQNELGWKDTVRMNPLENIVVAVNPITPLLPFPLPDSVRSLDVTLPDGVVSPAISGIDPATGNAITGGLGTTNAKVNFGWEYVWHCHILGHEENDMMRPMTYQVAPPAPSNLVASTSGTGVQLAFTDNSASESSFTVQRSLNDPTFATSQTISGVPSSSPASSYGTTLLYLDTPPPANPADVFYYRVRAEDNFLPTGPLQTPFIPQPMSSAWSNIATVSMIPIAGVSPTALAFGDQLVTTTSVPQTVTLSNAGGGALTISNITVTGDFAQSATTCGTTLNGGATCTIAITFTPTALWLRSGTLVISSNDPVNPTLTVLLSGNGIASTVTAIASNSPITYGVNGTVTVNITSPQLSPVVGSVTLSVDGGALLSQALVSGSTTFTLTAPAAGNHSLTASFAAQGGFQASTVTSTFIVNKAPLTITASSTTMTYGGTVPAITPTYSAFVLGQGPANLTGTVACTTNATTTSPVTGNPYSSSCTGATSTNYAITYVPGVVTINPATSTTTIISNLPSPSIVGQIVTVKFAVAPQFTGIPTGRVTVTATGGGSCNAALVAGAGSCTLTFSAGGNKTLTATYSGDTNFLTSNASANQVVSGLSLSTFSLLFGNQLVGTNSAAQTVTLSNVGTTTITGISFAWSANFSDSTNCGTSLAPGRSCRVNARFRPTTTGVLTGTLTITDSDPTSPQIVTLTGTGVSPVLSLSANALAYGNQSVNSTSAYQTVTVSNTGTAPLIINNIVLNGANPNQFTQNNNCPGTLAAGASCTVNVAFRPRSRGGKSANLTVNVAAPATSQSVGLMGTGI